MASNQFRAVSAGGAQLVLPCLHDIVDDTDDRPNYFNSTLRNSDHVLHPFFIDRIKPKYNLRQGIHQKELIPKSVNLNDRDFFVECYIRVAQKNWHTLFCTPYLREILSDFQTYFTIRIRRTFVIIPSLKIPPQLKCVATLPCEMSLS